MATLIRDPKERGMLDDTLVVWMGEFGRDAGSGDNHHASGWTTLWAGGGLKTGQVIGRTDDRGRIVERPISLTDYMATMCLALAAAAKHPNVYCKVSALVEQTGQKETPRGVKYRANASNPTSC